MTHTEYQDPKIDHTSWMQWIEENLTQVKDFFRQVVIELKIITKNIFFRLSKELRFFISKLTIVDFVGLSVTTVVMAFASIFILSGVGVFCYQVFLWMKSGIWTEFPIQVLFSFLFENTLLAQWLIKPESWFGLQRVVEWLLNNIPLSAALIVPSLLIFGAVVCISIVAIVFRFYQFKNSGEK